MGKPNDDQRPDLLETKFNRVRMNGVEFVEMAAAVLANGTVHDLADQKLPCDETGRFITPSVARACAICGVVLHSESAVRCEAVSCGKWTCEEHRFIDADGRTLCVTHDPFRRLVRMIVGSDVPGGQVE